MRTLVQDGLPSYSREDLHFLLWLKPSPHFLFFFSFWFLVNPKTDAGCPVGWGRNLGRDLPVLCLQPPEQGVCLWMETVAAATAAPPPPTRACHIARVLELNQGRTGSTRGSSVLYDLAWPPSPPFRVSSVGLSGTRTLLFVVQVQRFEKATLNNYTETTFGMERPADLVRTGNEFVRKSAERAENWGQAGGARWAPAGWW